MFPVRTTLDVSLPDLPGFEGTVEAVAFTDAGAVTTSFAWDADLEDGATLPDDTAFPASLPSGADDSWHAYASAPGARQVPTE